VNKDGRYSCSSTQSVIVHELHKQKNFRPVVLLVVAVHANMLFQHLGGMFCQLNTMDIVSFFISAIDIMKYILDVYSFQLP
jgi:hypothetical protein